MRRFHEVVQSGTEKVVVWGSGTSMREFLYVDDMAEACIFVMNFDDAIYRDNTQPILSHINVGTGEDCTIRDLAETMGRVTGFVGKLEFDCGKPDGTLRKLLDVSRLKALGWQARIGLEGLREIYAWFVTNQDRLRS